MFCKINWHKYSQRTSFFKELLMANLTQVDTPTKLPIDKSVIKKDEFFTNLKQKLKKSASGWGR